MRRTTALAAVVMVLLASSVALAGDPPPLDKATAAKILGFMGYKDITVKAVVQGIGRVSSPNTGMVLADVTQEGTRRGFDRNFFYDTDLGWFYFETPTEENKGKLRIWTVKGFQETETKPAPKKTTSASPGEPGGPEAANSKANLRRIGIAIVMYQQSENNKDKYPPDFQALVADGNPPKLFVSPVSGREDYVYTRLKSPPDCDWILVYERAENYQNRGTYVLYADYHVEWRTMGEFQEDLKRTVDPEAARAQRKTRRPTPDTFSVGMIRSTAVKRGEVQTIDVSVRLGAGDKQGVKLEVKVPPGLQVDPERTIVKPGDKDDLQLKITAANDAPLGDQKIIVKATPDKGESVEIEIKVRVIAE